MKGPNWFDKSDSMIDYFHVAWYLNINVGDFQRPYIYRGAAQAAWRLLLLWSGDIAPNDLERKTAPEIK